MWFISLFLSPCCLSSLLSNLFPVFLFHNLHFLILSIFLSTITVYPFSPLIQLSFALFISPFLYLSLPLYSSLPLFSLNISISLSLSFSLPQVNPILSRREEICHVSCCGRSWGRPEASVCQIVCVTFTDTHRQTHTDRHIHRFCLHYHPSVTSTRNINPEVSRSLETTIRDR